MNIGYYNNIKMSIIVKKKTLLGYNNTSNVLMLKYTTLCK